MCRLLAPRSLLLRVDGERVGVVFAPGDARIETWLEGAVVELETSRRTIVDVIDARHTLVSAVLADELVVRGAPADVLAFHDGLLAYVHGGVRAPAFPGLLARFRAGAGPSRRRRKSS